MVEQLSRIGVVREEIGGRTINGWVLLWRLDQGFNLLFGALLLLVAPQIIDWLAMGAGSVGYLRGLGAAFIVYFLWQIWEARDGTISRRAYLLAAVDMDLLGILLVAVLLGGASFNTLGVALTAALASAGFMLALFWSLAAFHSA